MVKRLFLLISVLLFLSGTLFGVFQLQKKFQQREGEIRGTVLWIATEVNREYWRFLDALSRYSLGAESITQDDLLLRRDLFWSQLSTYKSGDLGRHLMIAGKGEEIIIAIEATLIATESEMLSLKYGDADAGQALRERLLNFAMPIHQMTQRIDKSENEHFVDIFNQTEDILYILSLLVIALSVFGSVLIMLLIRETRRANPAFYPHFKLDFS